MPDYNLGTARGRIEIDSTGVATGVAAANAEMKGLQGSSAAAGASLSKVGIGLVGTSAAIGAGFAVAIKSASDFETRISAIAAVSGATEPELEKVRQKALQLGADTKYSASEAAQAMEELIKAGLSVDDVMNGAADATVNLAAAGEIDLPQAATIASNAMNAFGLAASDMPRVADLIAGAANASAIDVSEFGQALQQGGAVAHLAGVSFDDLSVAIAEMGNAGIKGSDAGTSLKTFLQNLQPQTKKQIDLFKELGIVTDDNTNQFYDQTGKLKSLREVSQILQDATAGMTQQQKQMALETMFGSDAIRAAAIVTENGAAGFDKLNEAMGKVTAQDVAAKRMDNLGGSIEQLKGSVETLLIVIGRPLAEGLRTWVDLGTKLVNSITTLDPHIIEIAVNILKVVAAATGIIGVFFLMTAAVEKFKVAMQALKIAMVGHPLLLLAVVIVALGVAFYEAYQNIQPFHDFVDQTFQMIKDTVMPVLEQLKLGILALGAAFSNKDVTSDGFVGFMERLGVTLRNVWDWINNLVDAVGGWGNVLKGAGAALLIMVSPVAALIAGLVLLYVKFQVVRDIVSKTGEIFVALGGWIKDNVFPPFIALGELLKAIWDRFMFLVNIVMPFVSAAFEVLKATIAAFADVVSILWDRFASHIADAIMFAFNIIKQIVESALRVIQGIIAVVTGIISGDWEKVWEGLKDIIGGVWDTIKRIPEFALEFIKQTITTFIDTIGAIWDIGWALIPRILSAAWDLAKNLFKAGLNALLTIGGELIGNIVDFFKAFPGRLLSALAGIGGVLLQVGINLMTGLWNGIQQYWQTILKWFLLLPIAIPLLLASALYWLVQAGIAIVQGLYNGIVSFVPTLWGWFTGLPGQIATLLATAGTWLLQTGIDLIVGLVKGIGQTEWMIIDWFTKLPGVIWNLVSQAPSWLLNTGIQLITGLINGIHNIEWMIWDWFRRLPGMIAGFVSGAIGWLYNVGRDIIQGLWNGISSMAFWIASQLPQIYWWIYNGVGQVLSWLVGKGKDIIQGLWDGINSMKDWILRKIGDFIDDAKHAVTHPWELLSPSKFMIRVGENIGKGMLIGLDNLSGDVVDAAGAMSQGAVDALKKAQLGDMAATWSSTLDARQALGAGTAGVGMTSGLGDTFVFQFPNVTSAQDAATIQATMQSPSVLTALTGAIKAGRR